MLQDNTNNEVFLLLFPQYKINFKLFDNIVNKLLTNIIKMYQKPIIPYSSNNEYEIVINYIKNYIDMILVFNPDDKSHELFIKQVIKSQKMIDKLYILCFP